ncbi:hypothetical protein B0H13DRAFT_2283800 [Mycena leptocephala]|nr:hypothetical protein B0H13DRAFT_2283800 [Mycena leptocephala]
MTLPRRDFASADERRYIRRGPKVEPILRSLDYLDGGRATPRSCSADGWKINEEKRCWRNICRKRGGWSGKALRECHLGDTRTSRSIACVESVLALIGGAEEKIRLGKKEKADFVLVGCFQSRTCGPKSFKCGSISSQLVCVAKRRNVLDEKKPQALEMWETPLNVGKESPWEEARKENGYKGIQNCCGPVTEVVVGTYERHTTTRHRLECYDGRFDSMGVEEIPINPSLCNAGGLQERKKFCWTSETLEAPQWDLTRQFIGLQKWHGEGYKLRMAEEKRCRRRKMFRSQLLQ